MNYVSMTLPDNPAERRHWLEGLIARGEASRFASEMAVIHECSLTAAALPAWSNAVCERGLTALSDVQLQELLQTPSLFVALAEEVFLNGGDYWTQRVAAETVFDDRVAHDRTQLLQALTPITAHPTVRPASPTRRLVTPWLIAFTSATAMVGVFFLYDSTRSVNVPQPAVQQPSATVAWGWQKTSDLATINDPAAYLERIAALAGEWEQQDTSTALALADRIAEFRQGCARLQLMEHKPLTDVQRKDLLARCQKWAKKFDESLADLEATGDVVGVKKLMDGTVKQLQTALRNQAAQWRTS